MKVIFTTNDLSIDTYPLLKVAIKSLQQNTTLEPVVVWSGKNNQMTTWLNEHNVQIIKHELSFKEQIKHFSFKNVRYTNQLLEKMYNHYPEYYNENFIITESLRIDIPILFKEEKYVMYADCDVIFLKDVKIKPFNTSLAAVIRENFYNNGIMIFNVPKMLESYEEFKQFYINSNYSFEIGNTTTQGAYNTFYNTFNGDVSYLPKELNWHGFWGINNDAVIIHLCGPKPKQLKQMINDRSETKDYDIIYEMCLNNSSKHYIDVWNEYADQEDKI